jgi:hypothetical protein
MTETTTAPAPVAPVTPPDPPAKAIQTALAAFNHPANLDLQSRLSALEQAVRIMAAHMLQEKSDV